MEDEIDALFKLPLGEFTPARNALVAQLKKAGRPAEANEAKALVKPSVSAWVVNQLYWRHRGLFDRLIEAGDQLRRAPAAQLKGESARESVNSRREAVAALAGIAADMLRDGNYSATRDMLRRVTSTLESLSSYGSLPGAPAAGRLTDDVEPPGFEAVTGFLPDSEKRTAGETGIRVRSPTAVPATKPLRREDQLGTAARRDQEDRKGLVAAAKTAVREAERALSAARKQAERAAAKLEAAAMRAKEIDSQRARIEKQLARASEDADAAHEHAREAAANAREATQVAEGVEHALDLARRRLQHLKEFKLP